MNTKKNVLRVSIAYVIYFAVLWVVAATCNGGNWCNIQEDGLLVSILYFLFPLLPIFLLSFITYKMRDEVFRAWWGFARWWVPIIILITLFLQNAGGGGGLGISGAVSGAFDALVLGILYTILVITSLFRIIRAYSQSKGTW